MSLSEACEVASIGCNLERSPSNFRRKQGPKRGYASTVSTSIGWRHGGLGANGRCDSVCLAVQRYDEMPRCCGRYVDNKAMVHVVEYSLPKRRMNMFVQQDQQWLSSHQRQDGNFACLGDRVMTKPGAICI